MTVGNNPWVSQPVTPVVKVQPPPISNWAGLQGPSVPQLGVPAPDRADQLEVRDHARAAELYFVGAHGGAGESSLATLSQSWSAAEHAWPRIANGSVRARVVIVARSNMQGLLAAQRAATQWGAGLVPFVDVVGLAIVADAPGKLPKPLRDFAAVVRGGVPRMWHLPWSDALRFGDTLDAATAHKDVRAFVTDLTATLTGAQSTSH
ncbi:hypothetical protein C5E07_11415 [Pseudoclavibacter sp. RFBJ3]|uniref:DUF6668 family protein n=1 Tax=unclassified Pseudoclavibacter TaxID=2615177 RepID=UPI000CE7FF7B|nr:MULTISPECIES: DUF6668 family protein [unclassified Pseudoclavibacter]PPF83295.1 hypothetical protein C5C12_10490 [Pseudoclavibacter sp. RFBJ5]PPF91837.1 hypothetical protein C5E07_11415 [Pseudoclavibacter sp. RFBJ3]PPG01115.1 hypothetical protein C5C19_00540 [Pseudoclavibacter sp. RFBH5]PPG26218.1 hypothetical protein C5E13_00495 [Pseudoclavibacter sp. RFBI4]